MKVCNHCGEEFGGRDGENVCDTCEQLMDARKKAKLAKRRQARKERDEVLRSVGLKKVRGALGGTYWE